MPKSTLGKWSAWLAAAVILLVAISMALVAIEQGGEEVPAQSPLPAVLGAAAGFSGVAAFVIGLIAIIRYKERSIPVYLAVGLGAVILLFNLGGLIFEG